MAKTKEEIKTAVEQARTIVREIYENDERLKQENPSSDSGIARETDIVFKEVLRHLLDR